MNHKSICTALACVMLSGPLAAANLKFGDALTKGAIKFDVDPGGDGFRNMQLNIKNQSSEPLNIELETGRIFTAERPHVQPYVVVRPAIVAINPGETQFVYLHARCGNSSAGSPREGDVFAKTYMGKDDMVKTLKEMNKFRITDSHFYQTVVWHYTNGHALSTVSSSETEPMVFNTIMNGMCKRENKEPSKYSKTFAPSSSGDDMEFSGVVSNIKTEFNMVLEKPADIRIVLVNNQGETVKALGYYMQQPIGSFHAPVEFNPSGINTGEYKLTMLNEDNEVIEQIPISI